MAINYTGHKLDYAVDDESDILSSWPVGTHVYVVNSNKNYILTSSGIYTLIAAPFSGSYVDLTNKPTLATVATSGSYNDLTSKPTIPSVTRTVSIISPSLVGTGATGVQISATKDSSVRVTISCSTTATIGGGSTSLVSLKICSTNNTTEANWTTVATFENDQTITLAVALQSVQVTKGQLMTDIPTGWYYKLVNSGTGTHSEIAITGQQTIYG